jgi:integrase
MLSEARVRTAKAGSKNIKLFDGLGLYLLLVPQGGKGWRFKYRFGGKEKLISLGTYPEVGLREAREKRDAARKQVASGKDPSVERKLAKAKAMAGSFEEVGREWFEKFSVAKGWVASHAANIIRRLERDIFPWLGNRPVGEITPAELLATLRRIEARGALDLAHRIQQICGQIFRYAVASGLAEHDPSADLRGALPPARIAHRPSLTEPQAIGGLLRAVEQYQGSLVVRCALRLAPYVFVRPGELRHAEWREFDLDGVEPVWRIPAGKMKMRTEHLVPLSRQAVAILHQLQPLTSTSRYVFPNRRGWSRPLSENALTAALRRMEYGPEEMTAHGFRTIASTLLNEIGFAPDAIERQLAHVERNQVRGAYNRAEYLSERRKMMQAWSDYLDGLRNGGTVIPLRHTA